MSRGPSSYPAALPGLAPSELSSPCCCCCCLVGAARSAPEEERGGGAGELPAVRSLERARNWGSCARPSAGRQAGKQGRRRRRSRPGNSQPEPCPTPSSPAGPGERRPRQTRWGGGARRKASCLRAHRAPLRLPLPQLVAREGEGALRRSLSARRRRQVLVRRRARRPGDLGFGGASPPLDPGDSGPGQARPGGGGGRRALCTRAGARTPPGLTPAGQLQRGTSVWRERWRAAVGQFGGELRKRKGP